MLKYLRIAVTTYSLTACVLLIVLWVRSNTLADICGLTFGHEKRTNFASEKGRIFLIIFDYETSIWAIGKHREWDIRSESFSTLYPMARTEAELIQQMGVPGFPGFYLKQFNGYYRAIVPHWFLVLCTATVAAAPWIRWRFSLRTLLIATTLVALVLGVTAVSS